jgi:P-type Ca2+ transporter type 2C
MTPDSTILGPSVPPAARPTSRDALATTVWHTLTVDATAALVTTDLLTGLSGEEAGRRLREIGPNALAAARQRSLVAMLLAQFRGWLMALLLAATVIAFVMGDTVEGVSILVVILLNATIGFLTEWKARQALTALQQQSVRVARVVRDGHDAEVPAADLVPGDVVVLAAGTRVPADGRLIESVRLQIEESALTGESQAVAKHAAPIADAGAAVGDRLNMAYLGTTITDGRGRLVVTATAARTEVGRIGALIDDATTRATPLERRIGQLGRVLLVLVLALCAVIVLVGWWRGLTDFWHMLEIGISLAIAAVPEGLPAVATMTMALGMQRMARMGALVRRLPAVETLGCTTVICTDKTGTLTRNEMTVRVFELADGRVDVSGSGYAPVGAFHEGERAAELAPDAPLGVALRIGALCNDATVTHVDGTHAVLGDPTEGALLVAAEKAGFSRESLTATAPRVSEVPFDSTSKRMITVHGVASGPLTAYVKGSPSVLLAASASQRGVAGITPLTDASRAHWQQVNAALAGAALRVLALAYREVPVGYIEADVGHDLIFVGLVGMSDPLREESAGAIARCRDAGIRTIMITGDQPLTAGEIARELGIDHDAQGHPLRVVHGRDLHDLDAAGWQAVVADAAVFARVSPEHKLQIVQALQQAGHVVAMTGDGVNDAPALKQADIGIAMGISGAEVAKENADMVITDDNFRTIVGAVEQGRIIYASILRFLHYLLSCNFSEILTVFLALLIGWPLPLVALQILWLNLITDIFPAFALALEPSDPDLMQRPPRDPHESLLAPRFLLRVVLQGLLLTTVTLGVFAVGMAWYGREGDGLRRATTMSFMTLALAQILHAFSVRSEARSVLVGAFRNRWLWSAIALCLLLQAAAVSVPFLRVVLRTVAPTLREWGVIVAGAVVPVLVVELVKWWQRATRAAGEAGRAAAA